MYGGVERHVDEISTRQVQRGHEVTVYVRSWYTPHDLTRYKGVHLCHLPSLRTKNFDAITHTLLSAFHAIFFLRPDVLHFHGVGPSLLSWIPRLLAPRITVIATFQSIDRTQEKWAWFARWMLTLGEWTCLRIPHQSITSSETLQEYSRTNFGCETAVIPNGVHTMKALEPKLLEETFGLTKQSYFLSVGRIVPCKGLEDLIAAFKKLDTEQQLVIVGDNPEQRAYVDSLKTLAAENPRIHFLGNQTGRALVELFTNASIFIQASHTEGMSMALLEGLASGVPVVASDIPANREVIETQHADQPIGTLFRVGDVEDLCRALEQTFKQREDLLERSKLATSIVTTFFSWDRVADQTLALYRAMRAYRALTMASRQTSA